MTGLFPQFAFRRTKRRIKTFLRCRRLPRSVLLISFPKCGRTWLHVMIGRYLVDRHRLEGTDFLSLGEIAAAVPGVERVITLHDDQPHKRQPGELVRSKAAYRRHKVIFLVRDPRDVIVSKFYSLRYREKRYQRELGSYVREAVGSLATITAYYNIWLEQSRKHPAFLLVRYEDLHANPERELKRIVPFLDRNRVDDAAIKRAVEVSRFSNMRALEDQGAVASSLLRPAEPGDYRTYKTRKGIVGDHLNEMGPAELAFVDAYLKRHLNPAFGYT